MHEYLYIWILQKLSKGTEHSIDITFLHICLTVKHIQTYIITAYNNYIVLSHKTVLNVVC